MTDYTVVILDRLDLYITDCIEDCISSIRENCVVLVDLKRNKCKKICPELCNIEFNLKFMNVQINSLVI